MKTKLLFALSYLLFSSQLFAQAPVWLWANGFGNPQGDERGNSIAFDAFGNVYTTGSFYGMMNVDPGPNGYFLTSAGFTIDIFIVKYNASGNFVWATSLGAGGFSQDYGYGITADAWGNVYTTGQFAGTVDFDPGPGTFNLVSGSGNDVFISKLDSSGNFLWAKQLGGANVDVGRAITTDASGNVYTTGYFQDMGDFDPGTGIYNLTSASITNPDIFISKLDSSGNFLWAKSMGGTGDDQGLSTAIDASGNVYTTGYFSGVADFDPGAGTFYLSATAFTDIFISKLDSSGNLLWAKRTGAGNIDSGFSLVLDASDNIFTTGKFGGTVDFDPGAGTFTMVSAGSLDVFISKLDSSGNFLWAKRMGAGGDDEGFSIGLDGSANVYTTGQFAGGATDFDPGVGIFNLTSAGLSDIFISKLDSSGNFLWAKGTGGANGDAGSSIAVDGPGNVVASGYFNSPSVSFDIFPLSNSGSTGSSSDAFVGRLYTIITTGNNEAKNVTNEISFFPNPSLNEVIIENGAFRIESIDVYDLPGKRILHRSTYGENKVVLDISSLPAGIYFVMVRDEKNNLVSGKIVKRWKR